MNTEKKDRTNLHQYTCTVK